MEVYEKKLIKLIAENKIHTNSELNEKTLAQALDIPPYMLSQLLNENIGKSFSEFINELRIEEAQRILSDPKNHDLTMYAVAVDSGFRSESVFYPNFKKYTGLTPTQFKKQAKKS
jgi:AraC-like DNA-binding protein